MVYRDKLYVVGGMGSQFPLNGSDEIQVFDISKLASGIDELREADVAEPSQSQGR